MKASLRRVFLGLTAVLATAGCSSYGYKGPVSDHFDGKRFHNAEPIEHEFADLLRWKRTRDNHPWERVEDFAPPTQPLARVTQGLAVTWINHATVLIQSDGVNILTDPIFSERASPFSWFGPRRYHPPGVAFEDLPEIDVVLISHAHYDHLDRPTVARLVERSDPLFIAGLGLEPWLRDAGATRVTTTDWWDTVDLPATLSVVAAPARHWSRRGLFDRNRTLWVSYWINTPAGAVYFAGDTGMASHFDAIAARLGAPRLALLPIGAYEPRWFMEQQHMNPADAVAAHQALGVEQSIGIHFGTFKLSDEGQQAPARALATAAKAAGLGGEDFVAPDFGQRFVFDAQGDR